MKKIISIVLLVIVLLFGIFRVFGGTSKKINFQTNKVEKGTIVSTVSASGRVEVSNLFTVMTTATGVVKTVFVKDGERVIAGQKIAEIALDSTGQQKNAAAWASYLSAKNSLTSTNIALYSTQSDMFTQWKTFKDLAESTSYDTPEERSLSEFIIAQNNWLASEAKYKNQQVVIDQSKTSVTSSWLSYQLSSSVVIAHTAGVVNNIGIVSGMILGSTSAQRVAVIQNEVKPIVTVNLTEIDVPKVKIGQKVTVILDSLQGKTFTGAIVTVDRIGTTSNNVTSYQSLIQLDTASPDIMPNMAASANIILETKSDVLLVPSASIQTQSGESMVRILKNGQERQVPVDIGISSDSQTEIISGINEGETVITGTVTNSTSGQRSSSIFGGASFRQGGFR